MLDTSKMKPCPFCGNNELVIQKQYSNDRTVIFYHLNHPPTNACSVKLMATNKEKVIEDWNKRINL